jgi:hypothetical protein
MLTEYRGHRSIGFCEKNFRNLSPIPADDVIDLTHLNRLLASVNRRFVSAVDCRLPSGKRFTIGEALLIDNHSFIITFKPS